MTGSETVREGSGWLVYSGVMLIIVGVVSVFDAIWAFRYSDTVADLIFFENDLAVWGWIWLIIGIVLISAGAQVFNRAQWARWLGVVAASVAIVSNVSWAQIQPTASLIGVVLASLVLYGLIAHGEA